MMKKKFMTWLGNFVEWLLVSHYPKLIPLHVLPPECIQFTCSNEAWRVRNDYRGGLITAAEGADRIVEKFLDADKTVYRLSGEESYDLLFLLYFDWLTESRYNLNEG